MRALEACLYTNDLTQAETFYTEVLGLSLYGKVPGRHLFYRLEGSMLLIFNPEASAQPGEVPPHTGKPGSHVCLSMERGETDTWQARLEGHGLKVTRHPWGRRGESLYFEDPAGNVLELAPASIWGLPQ